MLEWTILSIWSCPSILLFFCAALLSVEGWERVKRERNALLIDGVEYAEYAKYVCLGNWWVVGDERHSTRIPVLGDHLADQSFLSGNMLHVDKPHTYLVSARRPTN